MTDHDQPEGVTPYGFRWGPMEITRAMHVVGRGYSVLIETPTKRVHLGVSEAGRSVRFWVDGEEIGSDPCPTCKQEWSR